MYSGLALIHSKFILQGLINNYFDLALKLPYAWIINRHTIVLSSYSAIKFTLIINNRALGCTAIKFTLIVNIQSCSQIYYNKLHFDCQQTIVLSGVFQQNSQETKILMMEYNALNS